MDLFFTEPSDTDTVRHEFINDPLEIDPTIYDDQIELLSIDFFQRTETHGSFSVKF